MSSTHVLKAIDLTYAVVNEDFSTCIDYVTILDRIDSEFRSGELTAVMGASGAGKTHLFDLIIGNVQPSSKTSGCILYDGKERVWEEWIKKVSFLPQDDVYYPELTVYDSVSYYASYNEKLSGKEKKELTTKVLKSCCIYDKRNAVISSLSGGERKRAMIALAMIGQPEVLILDEPTSGLDSNNALLIVDSLKKYAIEKNAIVIMTVHQPGEGLFNLFDHLYYMTRNGVFYDGTVTGLQEWLTSHNIEKPDKISLCEFVFELHSKESVIPEIRRYDNIVNQIVQDNMRKEKLDEEPTVCNNNRVIVMEAKFFDIIRLLKHHFKIYKSQLSTWKAGLFLAAIGVLIYGAYVLAGFVVKLIPEDNSLTTFVPVSTVKSSVKRYLDSLTYSQTFFLGWLFYDKWIWICSYLGITVSVLLRSHHMDVVSKEILGGTYSIISYMLFRYAELLGITLIFSTAVVAVLAYLLSTVIYCNWCLYFTILLSNAIMCIFQCIVYMTVENCFKNDRLKSAIACLVLLYANRHTYVTNITVTDFVFSEEGLNAIIDSIYYKATTLASIFPTTLISYLQNTKGLRLLQSTLPLYTKYSFTLVYTCLCINVFAANNMLLSDSDIPIKVHWFTKLISVSDALIIFGILATACFNILVYVLVFIYRFAPNIRTKLNKTV